MLNQKHVTFYARSSRVRIDVAERDVVLTYVLKVCLGKTGRFSINLDFTGVCCCIQ